MTRELLDSLLNEGVLRTFQVGVKVGSRTSGLFRVLSMHPLRMGGNVPMPPTSCNDCNENSVKVNFLFFNDYGGFGSESCQTT
ncbi:hypothetical protein Poly59_61050 [Rubripirellula reticaptiva]|uniref:Uncharacterized protein n=1 Tax=Rubripirellula reticaptiva TaxID=2528013 RepID=A0A5C6EHH3_9BACT|nr:hypothetical protein Poly59_61050 [Rubripirellula reticaptiva]